jgi:glycosyltransferase involved in cell wall biosynthesis
MKVAVITPSFNDQQYIADCIKSVISQSYKNVRHYIYSDASTDNSINIIKSYCDQYDQVHIIGTENRGQAHGRNRLIDQAKKDGCSVLAFLDSDDRWYSNHIETNLPYLESHDVVYHDPEYRFENGQLAYPTGFVLPKIAISKSILYKNFIFISTSLARISAFDQVFYDDQLNSIEDWDVWCQLYQNGSKFVKNTESKTAIYVVKLNNNSSRDGPTKQKIIEFKRPISKKLVLNIGNMIQYRDDAVNISGILSVRADCHYHLPDLPYDDTTVHEIYVSDLIEKLGYHESAQAIQHWYNSLIPGGRLTIRTPDFMACCQSFAESDENQQVEMYRLFFGDPYNNNLNKFLFTEQQLRMHMSWSNFSTITRIPDQKNYLTLEAVK